MQGVEVSERLVYAACAVCGEYHEGYVMYRLKLMGLMGPGLMGPGLMCPGLMGPGLMGPARCHLGRRQPCCPHNPASVLRLRMSRGVDVTMVTVSPCVRRRG